MTRDPYDVLGLPPGSPPAEVKRAYRRLAKAFHPDSAGESALPVFLAIQDAYEQLTGVRPRSLRGASRGGATASAGGAGGQAGPAGPQGWREPWRADPARAREAREQSRSRRASPRSRADAGAPPAGSARRDSPPRPSSKPPGAAPAGSRRRQTRKATLGSTSYDEARDPMDPSWSGASWYGPTTGEYWIINPREYADPRKHGPGYRSRGGRGGRDDADATTPGPAATAEAAPEAAGTASKAEARRPSGASATAAGGSVGVGTTGSGGERARRAWSPPPAPAMAADPGAGEATRDALADAEASLESWFGTGGDPIRRLGVALVAWPPLGLLAAAVIGDVTGCADYAATCTGTAPLLPWLAQALILGTLLLLSPLARLFAWGSAAVLAAMLPATAVILVFGGAGIPEGGTAVAVLLAGAWIAGVAWGVRRTAVRGGVRAGPASGAAGSG